MKFEKCIKDMSNITDLKRIAKAHVEDSRNLNADELKLALIKTAGQYYSKDNVEKAMKKMLLSDDREDRTLHRIILKEILLNKDEYREKQRTVYYEVKAFEEGIIAASNEMSEKTLNDKNMLFFKFVLETAWERNDDISPDEKNLIEAIRKKLNITQREYRMLEAKMGRFPKKNNVVHSMDDVKKVRENMQREGLLFVFRNSEGEDFDIIPEEIADAMKAVYGKEMRDYGYRQMIDHKLLKNKEYLIDILMRGDIKCDQSMKVSQLQDLIIERIRPSNLIGGYSARDGLSKESLNLWCAELKLPVSGTKDEIISRIISYYDSIQEIKTDTADQREALFNVYGQLARRDHKYLRKQGIVEKDIECEKKFEEATDYMFEKIFRQKPLEMDGTDHPDGILSYQNKLIMWDNKSKETPVKLKEHIEQFTRYINQGKNKWEKDVMTFLVIAAEFTDESEVECMNFALNSDTSILLVRADDLKELAMRWKEKYGNVEKSFNLGYFKQSGKFNKDYVKL